MTADASTDKNPEQPTEPNAPFASSDVNGAVETPSTSAESSAAAETEPVAQGTGAPAAEVPSPQGAMDAMQVARGPQAPKTSPQIPSPQGGLSASLELDESQESSFHAILRQMPGVAVSAVLHAVVLVVMALWTLPPGITDELRQLVIAPTDAEMEELEELEEEIIEEIELDTSLEVADVETIIEPEPEATPFDDEQAAAVKVELSDFGLEKAPKNDLLATTGAYSGDALSGRGEGQRKTMVARHGGTEASERAVAMALQWLASVQCADGGWSFDHRLAPGGDGSRDPGSLQGARNGATGLALLPFLGAGQTHVKGRYQKTVKGGLYFLQQNMKLSNKGGSWHEAGGSMYSHGIAAITMCEAFAMTKDKGLFAPAQQSLAYICYAQDPVGGGWRYEERQPGDTSVVGWQIMALKSGHMGYFTIPPITVNRTVKFLDSVQTNEGALYGYTGPGNGPATTAVGLLCRMYLGWDKYHPGLQAGAEWLSNQGPSKSDMYYNYYATQVMRHMEGPMWKKWNEEMRDFLVGSQATQGHEAGSWYFSSGHGSDRGGRLYCTAMACMILEVYYRHLPIYQKQSTEEEFPLD